MAEELVADRTDGGALPTGTLTFLFTDIAGSTGLLREDREAYAAALEDHRHALRAAFAAHGGREVDTQGDAFFVAFPTAAQAAAAAADAQRALATTVPVRMGLHTGEAAPAGNGYVGLAVHHAARIAAAASGGQILLSGTTAALVAEEPLPAGTTLRPLGTHRLKDFPQPAVLYQLDVDGLPTHFPPPRTLARESRLPVPSGELVGRDDDVAALTALLRDPRTRLVTVTGAGGIGKTRLALAAARDAAADFPGGAVFVPLSAVTDPALVLPTLADAVSAGREPGQDPVDVVRTALGDDRTLLLVDNFEQVTAAAPALATLLDAVPAAVALVTSRQLLRLRAERHHPLGTLPEAAAVDLFAERAAAVRPGFTVDDTNADAVAEICRRLDGLPLAVELAAARIRLLPPAALLARLTEHLDVLGSGPVDLPERQRTLRATMDWSFGLLRPHEQALFPRLAVFSGGWTPEAAEQVCGRPGEPDVLDTLAALLDASLLVDGGNARLDMLDTVRGYAVEKLAASADRAETERRHTGWMTSVTQRALVGTGGWFRDAFEDLDRERANLRAAVQRAVDAGDAPTASVLLRNVAPYLSRRDGEREALGWLDQLLPRAADAPADVRGRLLVIRAVTLAFIGEFASIPALYGQARPLLPDDPEHAYDRATLAVAGAFAAADDGSAEDAVRRSEEASGRFAALGQELGVAFMAVFQASEALVRWDLAGAQRHYGEAIEIAGRLGDEGMLGSVLSQRGQVQLVCGDRAGGRRSILDAVEINRRGGQPSRIADSLEGLAAVALADDHPAVAARALTAAAAVRSTVGTTLFPGFVRLVDDLVRRSRERLGDEAYAAARTEARQWSPRDALDRTLGALAEP